MKSVEIVGPNPALTLIVPHESLPLVEFDESFRITTVATWLNDELSKVLSDSQGFEQDSKEITSVTLTTNVHLDPIQVPLADSNNGSLGNPLGTIRPVEP